MTHHGRQDAFSGGQIKAVRLTTKALSEEGEFEGYGSVFGNVDSDGDVIATGAFAESLKGHEAAGTMPALLWQHNPSEPIGVWTEMREDAKGLYVKGRLLVETQRGREAHALLKAGALTGMSIGFRVQSYEVDEDAGTFTLTGIDLWEVSLVTFPANGLARVSGVKARSEISELADWKSYEAYLRDAGGFSSRAAAAMVAVARRIGDTERDARKASAEITAAAQRLQDILKN